MLPMSPVLSMLAAHGWYCTCTPLCHLRRSHKDDYFSDAFWSLQLLHLLWAFVMITQQLYISLYIVRSFSAALL